MVQSRELEKLVGTGSFLTTLYMIDLGGKKTRVIPRDVQLHPVTDRPVHVDFMRLEAGATITLDIPVRFSGHDVSPGLKRGGTLNIVRHEVELVCPAENIPESSRRRSLGAGHQRFAAHLGDDAAGGRAPDRQARFHHRLHRGAVRPAPTQRPPKAKPPPRPLPPHRLPKRSKFTRTSLPSSFAGSG